MTYPVPSELADAVDEASRRLFRGRAKGDPEDPDVRTDGASWDYGTGDTATLTYRPALTAAEEQALRDTVAALRSGLPLAALTARKADIDALRAYAAVASPTAAQTAAVTKTLVRVVGMLLREDD